MTGKMLTGFGCFAPMGYFTRVSDGQRYVPMVLTSPFPPYEKIRTTRCIEEDETDGTDY